MDWSSPVKSFFDLALPFIDKVPAIRVILSIVLVFFLPGFAWTLVIFKQVNHIERVVLSFGLSIALVVLSVFVANVLFKIRVTGLNSLLIILVITVVPFVIYYANKRISRKKETTQ
jgi:uncharacterized membrane protein